MGATKAISVWPISQMRYAQLRNNQDALAEIPRTLAGNAATLSGWIVGGHLIGGDVNTPNPVPGCPGTGIPGHDHSGGFFGRPLRRTVALIGLGSGEDIVTSTYIDGGQTPNVATFTSVAASLTSTLFPRWGRFPVWVPGCDPGARGAYSALSVRVMGYIATATNIQAGDTLVFGISNHTSGDVGEVTVTDTSITATGHMRTGSQSKLLAMRPGEFNEVEIQSVSLVTDATAASRTLEVNLTFLEMGVDSSRTT